MECNLFSSCYHSYNITRDGKIYQKYKNEFLKSFIRDGYNEVLFSINCEKTRYTQWFRVDWLVATNYLPNPNRYSFVKHKDGNNLNDCVDNLEWQEFCTNEPAKIIPCYNNKYIVTNTGKVFNNFTGKEMKQRYILGYPHVALRVFKNGKSLQKLHKVHRLVADAFIPKTDGKNLVNHKDGIKNNNHVSNLEWVNHSENTIHAIKNNLTKTFWNKELGFIAINLIENYNYNYSDVGKLFKITRQNVAKFYQYSYKTWGLNTKNVHVKKHSNKKDIPEYYKNYITELLKVNTVLN